MEMHLTDEQAHTLRALLQDYLPSLRMEVARTDAREIRHELVKRQDVCEQVLELLEQAGV